MRLFLLFIALLSPLFASFTKQITYKEMKQPTLITFELSSDILQKGYFKIVDENNRSVDYTLKEATKRFVKHHKLVPKAYTRERNASISFKASNSFYFNQVTLNLQNRNFYAKFNLYIEKDDTLQQIAKDYPLYDYSNELGIHNFTIKLDKEYSAKKIVINYERDASEFFFSPLPLNRYQRYFKLKDIELSNNKANENIYQKLRFEPIERDEKSVVFAVEQTPFVKISFDINDSNYQKRLHLTYRDKKKNYRYLANGVLIDSTFNPQINNHAIDFRYERKADFIKVDTPDIEAITLHHFKKSLYFIAKPNKNYLIAYGLDHYQRVSSIDRLVNKSDFANATHATLTNPTKHTTKPPLIDKELLIAVVVLALSALLLYVVILVFKRL